MYTVECRKVRGIKVDHPSKILKKHVNNNTMTPQKVYPYPPKSCSQHHVPSTPKFDKNLVNTPLPPPPQKKMANPQGPSLWIFNQCSSMHAAWKQPESVLVLSLRLGLEEVLSIWKNKPFLWKSLPLVAIQDSKIRGSGIRSHFYFVSKTNLPNWEPKVFPSSPPTSTLQIFVVLIGQKMKTLFRHFYP